MGTSIYYGLKRKNPLAEKEQAILSEVTTKYHGFEEWATLIQNGGGELLSFYKPDPRQPHFQLRGSSKLPGQLFNDDPDGFFYVMDTWMDLFTELRNKIPEGEWLFNIEHQPFYWDSESKKYQRPR